jgi:lysozyme
VEIIKKWEGLRLKAYKCPAGVWTIGYGHTEGVKPGDVWTKEQAEKALERELEQRRASLLKLCPDLSDEPQNRLDACLSLAYNIGNTAFSRSSVYRFIVAKRYDDAANAFRLWNKAGGKVLNGLVRRREDERRLFLGLY